MTTARNQQVCIEATPYYHCVSRCVRRSFLCGYDAFSNRSYEHRRAWIEARIKALGAIYCIDICAYAVMSNHYHLVVHINKGKLDSLTDLEVIQRWALLHAKPVIIQRFLANQLRSKAEIRVALNIIEQWRERLYSLSWFMRELNFEIALKANKEDNCKGHFWESRYKSQALLDENALLAAMAYTDLNPVRAGIAKTPESSEYTSIKDRINTLDNQQTTASNLFPFIGNPTNEIHSGIPFRLMDYIELVDWSGKALRDGKASVNNQSPPILERLKLTRKEWLTVCTQLERKRALLVGGKTSIYSALSQLQRSRIRGCQLN
ncbi:transposase [Vibrio sp. DW001]|uniref:transposase n=1 Tax=Vibrio sp. DW001 TaxID=2912315 RepID=UPI0023B19962|nr:transposase [Vibrio sp. DW001]WED29376.1 transposase [Vibrio sp. DW001]